MEEVNQEVDFGVGVVKIGEKRCNNWKVTWKKFRKYLEDGRKQNKCKNFKQNKIQSELLKDVDDDECRWLQCNADARKTRAIQPTRADGRSNQMKEDKRYRGPRAVQVMQEI